MSRENVEVVRVLYARWTKGDFDEVGPFAAELRFALDASVSPSPGEWDGIDGMRRAWRENINAWDDYRTGEIEHLLDSGDSVVAFNRLHGRGKHSQIEADSRLAAAVFTFRDGKIVRLLLTDVKGALEAVGLSE